MRVARSGMGGWSAWIAGLTCAAGLAADTRAANLWMRLQFSNSNGTAEFSVPALGGQWQLPDPQTLVDPTTGLTVVTLMSASYEMRYVPQGQLQMSFTIQTANTPDPTAVLAESPLMTFQAGDGLGARAGLVASLWDLSFDGWLEMLPLTAGGAGMMNAWYNETTFFGSVGNDFRLNQGPGAAGTNGWYRPTQDGFEPIGEPVWALSTDLAFTLTPGDWADIVAVMTLSDAVVPEPTAVLLLLPVVGLLRRGRA